MLVDIILAAFIIMLASLAGAISIWRHFGAIIERNLTLLVSFSAGVFLLIFIELAHEALEHSSRGLWWIIAGAVGVFVIFRIVPSFHHHHDEADHSHTHSSLDARRILLSDAVHNVGDGILLVSSFALSVPLGIATTATIFVHEVVQEISEFFVLRQAGYAPRRALVLNFLVSSTILIGAIGSFFLLEEFEHFKTPLLGLAAGALIVVVFYDLIPHSVRASRKNSRYVRHIIWFALGALLMFSVQTTLGH